MTEHPIDQQIDAVLRRHFQPPPGLAARIEGALRQPQRRRRPLAPAWVLVAAALLVAALVMLLQQDRRPVLEAGVLHDRVSHWSDLTGCSVAGIPLPQPLAGPKLLVEGAQVNGPYAVTEWPGAALFRVEVNEPAALPAAGRRVHALLVVPRRDATRYRVAVNGAFTATVRTLGELQVFDFHRHGTPAVADQVRRATD